MAIRLFDIKFLSNLRTCLNEIYELIYATWEPYHQITEWQVAVERNGIRILRVAADVHDSSHSLSYDRSVTSSKASSI
jgi:hypothetical protein